MIHLDAAEFRSNPYIKNIKIPTAKVGNFTLTTAAYEPGELLEYDMPDFSRNPIERRVTPETLDINKTIPVKL